jgi:hypothetical protein
MRGGGHFLPETLSARNHAQYIRMHCMPASNDFVSLSSKTLCTLFHERQGDIVNIALIFFKEFVPCMYTLHVSSSLPCVTSKVMLTLTSQLLISLVTLNYSN